MGWLQRLFGQEKPEGAQVNPTPVEETHPETGETIPPERIGLNGEYDQSGLAKRVALAFDQDADLADIDTLYVAQLGNTVVLKGEAPSQDIVNHALQIALAVQGAGNVETEQVTVNS